MTLEDRYGPTCSDGNQTSEQDRKWSRVIARTEGIF